MGAYETLKRGLDISDHRYMAAKAVSNSFWLLLWILMLVHIGRPPRAADHPRPLEPVLMLSFCYFYAIDTVFQGGARHHVPVAATVAALASLGSGGTQGDRERPEREPIGR